MGLSVELAASGAEALPRLTAAARTPRPFGLVLVDFEMPEMDGTVLARNIKSTPSLARVPVLLLTSYDRRVIPSPLAAVGIAGTVAKPIRQQELLDAVLRALAPESAIARARRATDEPEGCAGDEVPPKPPLRILVAEDNPVNQRLTLLQLRKIGYRADLVANGREVLEVLERKEIDVVLMDCQMPELDGLQATKRIRTSGKYPELRIIAMTANAMAGDRETCLAAGMDDYLSKPTTLDDLRAALLRVGDAVAEPVEIEESGARPS
jgi:CheY-like chemotaxis protein